MLTLTLSLTKLRGNDPLGLENCSTRPRKSRIVCKKKFGDAK
jgi:hypothetical protein